MIHRGFPLGDALDLPTPGEIAEVRARSTLIALPELIDQGIYFRPRADLLGIVEMFGVIHFRPGVTRDWHWHRLPEGNAFIIYVRGVRPDGEFSRLFAVGPRSAAHIDPVADAQLAVAARFPVGSTAGVFRADASHLADGLEDVEALWGARGVALRRRLDDARCDEEMVLVLERALAGRLVSQPWDRLGGQAAAIVVAHGGCLRLEELERRVGYSRRHLRRRFEQAVGFSPKRFGRIARFRSVMDILMHAKRPNWRLLAAEHGYYDQSHLIADFRAFTGFTPTDLLAHEHFGAVRAHETILRRRTLTP